MNEREKKLAVVLGAVVGVGVVLFLGLNWFWRPLQAYNKTIEDLTTETDNRQAALKSFLKERKKLEVARIKSLPTNSNEANLEYTHFLQKALEESGLLMETLNPAANLTNVKPPASVPGVKSVDHKTLTFQVRARGELGQLVKFMERMQKTPYEHRIKILSVDRVDPSNFGKNASSKLNVQMTIETLLVAKTASRVGLPPGVGSRFILAESIASLNAISARPVGLGMIAAALQLKQEVSFPDYRKYADISRRNIFIGGFAQREEFEKGESGPVAAFQVPPYVRLDTCVPDTQEAYLRNLIVKTREIKLIAKPRSGFDTFKIIGEDTDGGDFLFVHAKVLRVEAREVYFQVGNQVFEMHIGQSIADALRRPISTEKMDDLDLFDVFDIAWAKEHSGKDKDNAKTAKTSKKGGKKQ